jgi:hypothetical protein
VTSAMWNLVSVYLEIVLASVQDRCTVCTEHTTCPGIVSDAHNETARTLGPHVVDEAQVEARFSPFGDSANLDARLVHGLRRTYHRLGNNFGWT